MLCSLQKAGQTKRHGITRVGGGLYTFLNEGNALSEVKNQIHGSNGYKWHDNFIIFKNMKKFKPKNLGDPFYQRAWIPYYPRALYLSY